MDTQPTTVFWLTPDQWTALSAIGTMLSFFATACAVWITLAALRHAQDPKVRVFFSVMEIVNQPPKEEYLFLTVINVGAVPFVIHSLYWKMGYWPLEVMHGFMLAEHTKYTRTLPVRLGPSEEYKLIYPVKGYHFWLTQWGERLANKELPREYAKSLRLGVSLTHGTSHTKRVSREDAKFVLQAAVNKRQKSESLKKVDD